MIDIYHETSTKKICDVYVPPEKKIKIQRRHWKETKKKPSRDYRLAENNEK